MLKKNQAPRLNHDSTMGVVFNCIAQSPKTRTEVILETRLRSGQVKSALHNLVYVGLVSFSKDGERILYSEKQEDGIQSRFCDGWANAPSVFSFKA